MLIHHQWLRKASPWL